MTAALLLLAKPTVNFDRRPRLAVALKVKLTWGERDMLDALLRLMHRRRSWIIDINASEAAAEHGCNDPDHAARLMRRLARKGAIIKHKVRGNYLLIERNFNFAGEAGADPPWPLPRASEGPRPNSGHANRKGGASRHPPTSPRAAPGAALSPAPGAALPVAPIEERAGNSDSGEIENVTFNVVGSLISGGDRSPPDVPAVTDHESPPPVPAEDPTPLPVVVAGDRLRGYQALHRWAVRAAGAVKFRLVGDNKLEPILDYEVPALTADEQARLDRETPDIVTELLGQSRARTDRTPQPAGGRSSRRVSPADHAKLIAAVGVVAASADQAVDQAAKQAAADGLVGRLESIFRDKDPAQSRKQYRGHVRELQLGLKTPEFLLTAIEAACKLGVENPGAAFTASCRRQQADYHRRSRARCASRSPGAGALVGEAMPSVRLRM
jgi:hypothetical protein